MTNKFQYIHDNQLIVITGARGVGKTTFAATFSPATKEAMSRVFWHDSEQSANRVRKDFEDAKMPFGYYMNLGSRFSDLESSEDLLAKINKGELPWVSANQRGTLSSYYEYILNDIDKNLTPGRYDIYVHDTLEKLESGMMAWVENNKRKAGVTSVAFGKLWSEGVYPLYEMLIESLFSRGVKTIILASHLKNPWEGGRPIPGKVAPSGKKLLYKLSSLMIWLVNERSNETGTPAGLILKERMGKIVPKNGTWQPRRMLPERIPHCTWADIDRYLTDGCDLSNPATGETMSRQEKDMISELLTDEQMKLMILSEEKDVEELKQQSGTGILTTDVPATVDEVVEEKAKKVDVSNAQETAIDLYVKQGMNNVKIGETLNLPLPEVLKARRKLGV